MKKSVFALELFWIIPFFLSVAILHKTFHAVKLSGNATEISINSRIDSLSSLLVLLSK
ncbi:MAG TPA: hypothetical protein VKA92_06140 [Segetibacter sp.]|nr:hypothetical protein [Segetibacter sp.]